MPAYPEAGSDVDSHLWNPSFEIPDRCVEVRLPREDCCSPESQNCLRQSKRIVSLASKSRIASIELIRSEDHKKLWEPSLRFVGEWRSWLLWSRQAPAANAFIPMSARHSYFGLAHLLPSRSPARLFPLPFRPSDILRVSIFYHTICSSRSNPHYPTSIILKISGNPSGK